MKTEMKLRRSPTLEIGEKIKAAKSENKKLFSLSTPSLPNYIGELKTDKTWGKLTPAAGLPELIERTETEIFENWNCSNHKVVISAGAKSALFTILKCITNSQDRVLIPSPCWPSYIDICTVADCLPIEMPTRFSNNFCMELEEIESAYLENQFKVIVFSNPNNPTGVIYDGEFLQALDELAQNYGFYIIIDQSFSKVIFDFEKWQSSYFINSDKVFIVDSFSKNYLLQGARVAATLVPSDMEENFINIHQTILSSAPAPAQIMALKALEKNLVIPSLHNQREKTQAFITAQKWDFIQQTGSFYFFPRVDDFKNFEEKAQSENILILKGSIFGAEYSNHFRLCFARPLLELETIFNRLDRILNGR